MFINLLTSSPLQIQVLDDELIFAISVDVFFFKFYYATVVLLFLVKLYSDNSTKLNVRCYDNVVFSSV